MPGQCTNIGNMSENGEIVNVLNMTAYTGNFKNELQTSEEPYSWKLVFENDFSANRQDEFEERLTDYAYIYLSQIGNLSEVIYEYKLDGEVTTLSVTSDDATEFAGMDIKSIGTDVNLLEKLVQKTGLSNVVLGGVAVDVNSQVDSSNSDETDGENVDFQLIPEDFSKKIENGSKAIVTLRVLDDNGNRHEVQGEVYVDLYWGNQYKLNLSGNAKDGYFLGH